MDLIGEFHPASSKGNCYTLTAICMLTGFTFCISLKNKTAEEVIKAYLNHICCVFGPSKKILTDNGTEFKNRKEKAEEEAKQTKYFPCKDCVEGFNTKRELDIHMMDKHIFICGECLRIFKIKAERDTHMEKDHKGVSTEMTKQEKLLAEEWHKRESREEKDR